MILDLDSCPTCGAVTASEDGRARHAAWHHGLNAAIDSHDSLAQIEEPISAHAERIGREIASEEEVIITTTDWKPGDMLTSVAAADADAAYDAARDYEPPPPIPRHPQISEHDWGTLNHEQKNDVNQRVQRIAKMQATATNPDAHVIDRQSAETQLVTELATLLEDYAFELLPAEEIEQADAAFTGEPPPRVGPSSPPLGEDMLRRRSTYLLAKQGLPVDAEQDRREELAEIERRLAGHR